MAKKKKSSAKSKRKKVVSRKSKKKVTKKRKKKPSWKVKRVKQNQAIVTLPEGMKFTSQKLSIEDIIEAIQKHGIIENGESDDRGNVVVKCCSGNTAIA